MSRSTQGNHLNKLWWAWGPNATLVIGPLVPEKRIFERFLPHMGMAAILFMWPRCPEQTFVPPTHGGSTWNLASVGPAVLEKKIFENGGRTDDNGRQRTTDGACQYYKLTNEHKGSGELKTNLLLKSVYFRVSGRPGTGDTQLLESWPWVLYAGNRFSFFWRWLVDHAD